MEVLDLRNLDICVRFAIRVGETFGKLSMPSCCSPFILSKVIARSMGRSPGTFLFLRKSTSFVIPQDLFQTIALLLILCLLCCRSTQQWD